MYIESGYDGKRNAIWRSSANNVFVTGCMTVLHYMDSSSATTTTTVPQKQCPAEQLYGENSEETELLRIFRDNLPGKTPEGHELIKLSYQWAPVIVKTMGEDKEFKGSCEGHHGWDFTTDYDRRRIDLRKAPYLNSRESQSVDK